MNHPFLATILIYLPAPPILGRDEEPAPASLLAPALVELAVSCKDIYTGSWERAGTEVLPLTYLQHARERLFLVEDQLALLGRRLWHGQHHLTAMEGKGSGHEGGQGRRRAVAGLRG